jgi:ABC-type transporter Mla maintaining outer membrane lipid asymmetry ATPase subunit MlaF
MSKLHITKNTHNTVMEDVTFRFELGRPTLYRAERMGKTVLLKCLVGLIEFVQGQVFYDYRPFSEMSFNERRRSGRKSGIAVQAALSISNGRTSDVPAYLFTSMTLAEKY